MSSKNLGTSLPASELPCRKHEDEWCVLDVHTIRRSALAQAQSDRFRATACHSLNSGDFWDLGRSGLMRRRWGLPGIYGRAALDHSRTTDRPQLPGIGPVAGTLYSDV